MSLPQELIDSIIDSIPRIEPFSDLKNCSLVAKTFRHKAQRNFFPDSFSTIMLPIRARSGDLSPQLKRCEDFHELVQANPDIATLVRHITFEDMDLADAIESREGHRMEFMDETRHLVDHTLHLVLDQLVNLKILELYLFDLSRASAKFAAALLRRPVTCLVLDDVLFHRLGDLLTLIRSSPELRSLSLGNITLLDYECQLVNMSYETERLTPDYDKLVPSAKLHSPAEVETVVFGSCNASVLLCMEALRSPGSPISLGRIENLEMYSQAVDESIPGSVNKTLAKISIWLRSLQPHLRKRVLSRLIPRDHAGQPDSAGPAFHIKHVELLHVAFNLNSTEDLATSLEWWSHNFEVACG
ncbi:hypothetical protein DFS33DRAFT_650881 [Desarmillaria ectypa]|nr:hypothetical protein DFS33DRAFT_650881 [Desarmillaria ectypa]